MSELMVTVALVAEVVLLEELPSGVELDTVALFARMVPWAVEEGTRAVIVTF